MGLVQDPDATIPAWASEDVHIVDPDPRWPAQAERYTAEIRELLCDWFAGPIEHIGSTAVPGLAAKPVIDLQATAADPATAVATTRDALAASSWFVVPRELDQRPWRWFIVRADEAGKHRLAHLHLMRTGELRWQQQLIFRDALRADTGLVEEYARLKARSAMNHRRDREAYTRDKQAFVHRVINQAKP